MIWMPVVGFEGYYEVSSNGDVKSIERIVTDVNGIKHHIKEHTMKATITKDRNGNDGYYVVNLHKNGKSCVMCVHVLVAMAFIQNPLNLPTVNHIDGCKSNNTVENLEWTSYSENNTHALKMGLRSPRGTQIIQILNGELVEVYNSVCEASRQTGIGRSMISHCVNGRTSSAGGYVWKKLSEGLTTNS